METSTRTQSKAALHHPKDYFLENYEREHRTTMRVLRAYPPDKTDLRPHAKCRTAHELAWVFAMDYGLGIMVYKNEFEDKMGGPMPQAPEAWDDVLAAIETGHADFGEIIRQTPEEELFENVRFFTAPKTMGEVSRLDWIWFLVHDQIHHRGQFSIYLRMADGAVPSIYGPTADEPWM